MHPQTVIGCAVAHKAVGHSTVLPGGARGFDGMHIAHERVLGNDYARLYWLCSQPGAWSGCRQALSWNDLDLGVGRYSPGHGFNTSDSEEVSQHFDRSLQQTLEEESTSLPRLGSRFEVSREERCGSHGTQRPL